MMEDVVASRRSVVNIIPGEALVLPWMFGVTGHGCAVDFPPKHVGCNLVQ